MYAYAIGDIIQVTSRRSSLCGERGRITHRSRGPHTSEPSYSVNLLAEATRGGVFGESALQQYVPNGRA